MGHMNVQHYVGMFDQAAFHFQAALGLKFHHLKEEGEVLIDAQHTIQYKREQPVGSLVTISSCLTRMGTKSVTALHRMVNTETGDLAATSEIVSVYFDLRTRKSLPIPGDIKAKLQAHVVEAP
jgi:acyl-CoA thioester hydrolase